MLRELTGHAEDLGQFLAPVWWLTNIGNSSCGGLCHRLLITDTVHNVLQLHSRRQNVYMYKIQKNAPFNNH